MQKLSRPPAKRDLSDFVLARRKRTRPEEVGLTASTRRRTPGLRREEVAQIAGVGVTWYTWFEQGRDIRVSTHFLESVCKALCLSKAERAHLFMLAQNRPPPHEVLDKPRVTEAVLRMLNSLPNPAYITTQHWDVVAWNAPAQEIFCDYAEVPPDRRNHLWLVFTEPRLRRVMLDWEKVAHDMLAKFRVNYGRSNGDPAFEALIAMLNEHSVEFRTWWPLQDVRIESEGVKCLKHDTLGRVQLEHTAFLVEGSPDLRMVIYTPVPH